MILFASTLTLDQDFCSLGMPPTALGELLIGILRVMRRLAIFGPSEAFSVIFVSLVVVVLLSRSAHRDDPGVASCRVFAVLMIYIAIYSLNVRAFLPHL